MNDIVRQVLMPLAIMTGFGGALVAFTRALTDHDLKKKMIERGFVNEDTQSIFKKHSAENKYASLKWGLIIFFAGLSLIIMEYIEFDRQSPLPYGLFAVSVSIGFLIYYFIVSKKDIK
jgi:hypothetical protein